MKRIILAFLILLSIPIFALDRSAFKLDSVVSDWGHGCQYYTADLSAVAVDANLASPTMAVSYSSGRIWGGGWEVLLPAKKTRTYWVPLVKCENVTSKNGTVEECNDYGEYASEDYIADEWTPMNSTYKFPKLAKTRMRYCASYEMKLLPGGGWGVSTDLVPSFAGNAYPEYAWWNISWIYRQKCPYNATNITEDLVDFPVPCLISMDDAKMKADCSDLRPATNDTNSPLFYEIENNTCVPDSDVVVWAKKNITAGEIGAYYVYYGNPDAVSAEDAAQVWVNYDNVYHLVNQSNVWRDSKNSIHLTTKWQTPRTETTYCKFGTNCLNGTNGGIYATTTAYNNGSLYVSCWGRLTAGGTYNRMYAKTVNSFNQYVLNIIPSSSITYNLTDYNPSGFPIKGNTAIANSQWYHFAFLTNASPLTGTGWLYQNGIQVGTGTWTYGNFPSANRFCFGATCQDLDTGYFPGALDECRVSTQISKFTADYIRAEYELIAYAENEETQPPVVTLYIPLNGTSNLSSTIPFGFMATSYNDSSFNCSIYINGTLNESDTDYANGTIGQFVISGLEDGNYTWDVRCVDGYGITGNSETRSFSVFDLERKICEDTLFGFVLVASSLYGFAALMLFLALYAFAKKSENWFWEHVWLIAAFLILIYDFTLTRDAFEALEFSELDALATGLLTVIEYAMLLICASLVLTFTWMILLRLYALAGGGALNGGDDDG